MTDPPESFSAYVRVRTAGLTRIAFLLTGDHHLAEDLVQQTLLRVVGGWGRIVAQGDPDAYVRQTLYHQHVSWWRRRRRTLESAGTDPEPAAPDPSDAVVAAVAVQRALAQLAPRLPADLWVRGRARQRCRVLAVGLVLALTALAGLVPVVAASRARPVPPAHDQSSVPSTVYGPLPFQRTVQDAPPGPATVLLTGPGGFGTSDMTGYEDRALVVGATGEYRWLRNVNGFDAGESVLLSPDGRYVAGDGGVEGAAAGDGRLADRTVVVDLSTGRTRTFDAGYPLAWTPDGRSLLTNQDNGLRRLSPDSGAVVGGPTAMRWSCATCPLATPGRTPMRSRRWAAGLNWWH